ncbi:hypothetical protein QJS10_CPB15g00696 [Acorus calamus]|uniref:Uncharacterized protein n=1 Tax=Acorus calamus TaxID=4465 RepID=A0AAV9D4S4_ACOCL|nr:hypothetical protein QJS10_CPB15g00696 [Acorus calamus]
MVPLTHHCSVGEENSKVFFSFAILISFLHGISRETKVNMEDQRDTNINLEKEVEVENGVNLELSIMRACDVSNTSNNKTIAADCATLSSCSNSKKPYRHSNAQIQALEE